MHVLVTGGAGFIGTHLVRTLLEDPTVTIRVLDNLSRGWNTFSGISRIEFLRGDIRDRRTVLAAMDGIDLVYHLAAQSNVLGAVRDLDYSFAANVVGTYEVLSAARACGCRRLVFTSSREVYGEVAVLPVPESASLNPKNAYGASKAAGELYCRVFVESGMDVVLFRLANVYGPGDSDRVIPRFVTNALAGLPLVIYGENKILDFVWIGDVVDALLKAQTAPIAGQTLNIGSGEGIILPELAQSVLRVTGSSSLIQSASARTMEIDRFVADIRLAERLLGYHPSTALAHLPETAGAFPR
jgi:UDP-glucose 4-epimerase